MARRGGTMDNRIDAVKLEIPLHRVRIHQVELLSPRRKDSVATLHLLMKIAADKSSTARKHYDHYNAPLSFAALAVRS